MSNTLRVIIALCGVVVCISAANTAMAHILVTDSTKSVGAILHVTPDDDPIAGQTASLFYDIQRDISEVKPESIDLTITSSDGGEVAIPITIKGSYISASYTFANRGAYTITLRIPTKSEVLSFTSVQRVSRGGSATDAPQSYTWAKIGVITPVCIIALLAIVAFNHRKNIRSQTK